MILITYFLVFFCIVDYVFLFFLWVRLCFIIFECICYIYFCSLIDMVDGIIGNENKKLKSNFLTWLLLILPTILFFVILWRIISLILSRVGNIVSLFPDILLDKLWWPEVIVHFLWFLVLCWLIWLLWFVMNYGRIWERVKNFLDPLISKVPLLNSLTKITNQAANTLRNTNSFKKVVLVKFPTEKTRSVWFLTWENLSNFENAIWGTDLVSVFIPTTPNPANGYLVMLNPIDFIETEVSVSDAISFVISMGTVWASNKIVKKIHSMKK